MLPFVLCAHLCGSVFGVLLLMLLLLLLLCCCQCQCVQAPDGTAGRAEAPAGRRVRATKKIFASSSSRRSGGAGLSEARGRPGRARETPAGAAAASVRHSGLPLWVGGGVIPLRCRLWEIAAGGAAAGGGRRGLFSALGNPRRGGAEGRLLVQSDMCAIRVASRRSISAGLEGRGSSRGSSRGGLARHCAALYCAGGCWALFPGRCALGVVPWELCSIVQCIV